MAKRKVKRIIFWCVIGHVALTFTGIGLVFLSMWSPWEKGPTIGHYADDDNYVRATGLISGSVLEWEQYRLSFSWIHAESCDEKSAFVTSDKAFVVWFSNPETASFMCNPLIGREVSIICCKGDFLRHPIPDSIVQLSFGESEILPYADGKSALLQYVASLWP